MHGRQRCIQYWYTKKGGGESAEGVLKHFTPKYKSTLTYVLHYKRCTQGTGMRGCEIKSPQLEGKHPKHIEAPKDTGYAFISKNNTKLHLIIEVPAIQ